MANILTFGFLLIGATVLCSVRAVDVESLGDRTNEVKRIMSDWYDLQERKRFYKEVRDSVLGGGQGDMKTKLAMIEKMLANDLTQNSKIKNQHTKNMIRLG